MSTIAGWAPVTTAVDALKAKTAPQAGEPGSNLLGPPAPTQPIPKPITVSPVHPNLGTLPTGPPVALFKNLGAGLLTVDEFNQRLEHVTATSVAQTGVKPNPEDALRAALSGPTYIPVAAPDPATAKSQAALALHPAISDSQFVSALSKASANGTDSYEQFVDGNEARLRELQQDPAFKGRVAAVINYQTSLKASGVTVNAPGSKQHIPTAQEEGLAPPALVKQGWGLLGRAVDQVGDSLIHAPAGAALAVVDVGRDVFDAGKYVGSSGQEGSDTFDRTQNIAKASLASTEQDIHHPGQNPGYLFLDVLGLASAGVGGAARVAEAGRVARAGEGAIAVGKALASKPELKSFTLTKGGFSEQTPLSSNPLSAWLQVNTPVLGLKARQARAEASLGDLSGPGIVARPTNWATDWLSFERKIGRAGDARRRVEYQAAMAPKQLLDEAAGHTAAQTGILRALPQRILGGLSRGEQKAIQVISWDDPDPLEAERQFHENAIKNGVGDPEAHREQLANVKLAAKALAKPSPRLEKALDATVNVMAENQRLRIEELGLTPEAAAGRIAKTGQALRGETLEGGDPLTEHSFYLPTKSPSAPGRVPSSTLGFYRASLGPYGMGPAASLPELAHEFTGGVIREGDMRIDSTNLAGETYAKTVRAVSVKNDWQKAWEAATATPSSPEDIAIRDIKNISPELRDALTTLDEGYTTQADLEELPADLRKVIEALYVKADQLPENELPHVRWIDPRLLGQSGSAPRLAGPLGKIADKINDALRPALFYVKPAYALNKLGNDAMLVFDQGFLNAGTNLVRAMRAEHLYGEANAAKMRSIVGAGRQASYVNNASGRLNTALGEFWNRFADRDERVASFLYYARRKGYKTPEQLDTLLNDKEHADNLVDVSGRAKKALVEFDNLTPYEKATIRHFLFVYPWVRGSAVWSIRAIFEHPSKTALLSKLGEQAEDEEDKWLGNAPRWFKETGYIPIGWNGDGTPRVVDPSSINTFSTLGEIIDTVRAGTEGDPTASIASNFGPVGQFVLSAVTGRDQYGNAYAGPQIIGAFKTAMETSLPEVAAVERHDRAANQPSTKGFKITERASLEASQNSALHQSILTPGWLSGFGNLIAGGFSPSNVNLNAAAAKYWQTATPAQKNQREVKLLNQALTLQGSYLERPVPTGVRAAVKEGAELTQRYRTFAKDNGRTPTAKERAGIALDYLAANDRIPDGQVAGLRKQLAGLDIAGDITAFNASLMTKYANAGKLAEWDRDVRVAASFTPALLTQKATELRAFGVPVQDATNTPGAKLHSYALGYVDYLHGLQMIDDGKSPTKAADARLYDEEPHTGQIDGLPSYEALRFATKKPAEQEHAIVGYATGSWGSLSAFEKQIAGKPVAPGTTEAWRAYESLTSPAELAKQLPAGQRTLDKAQKLDAVKQIDKYYGLGGKFTQDYLYAQKPLYQRLGYLNVVKDSPHKADWHELFAEANKLETAIDEERANPSSGGRITQLQDSWRDYVAQLPGYYKTENPAFWSELQPIIAQDPGFLAGLIN